jgi:hypothetical protein
MGSHANPQFLYLTTKGWKTGKQHRIEIWFVQYNKRYYIMSELLEFAHWVQNIIHDPHVVIHFLSGSCSVFLILVSNSELTELDIDAIFEMVVVSLVGIIVCSSKAFYHIVTCASI